MRNLIFVCLIGCFVLNINSCIQSKEGDKLDIDRIENEIRLMTDSFHRDIKSDGFTAEFKYLDSSEDFFWVIPGSDHPMYYDTIRSIIEKNAQDFRNIELHWDLLKIHVMEKSLASYTGIVGGHMHQISSDSTWNISIIESGTFIKRKSGWKFLCGQSRNN